MSGEFWFMYLLALDLPAGFALADTSEAAPSRGARSNHFGRLGITPSKLRAGTNRPGPAVVGFALAFKYSRRTPGLIVSRPSVHASWANRPRSAFRYCLAQTGAFRTVTLSATPLR